MRWICETEKCTGCGACANVCPHKCIILKLDNEGFLYPVINETQCVKCDRCKSICPVNHEINNYANVPFAVYKAYSEDSELLKICSSGGVFLELAKSVFQMGGLVFGAVLNEHFSVVHTMAETIDELYPMSGSKYIGSRIGDMFQSVERFLKRGRVVLFSGTPCQIVGLKSFLRNQYENLYTCDFICHGVGSEHVLHAFLSKEEQNNGSAIHSIRFREKNGYYLRSKFEILFESGKVKKMPSYNNSFGYPFSIGLINRKSCSECRFATVLRYSDITMADLIHNLNRSEKRRGASLVLANTEKGDILLMHSKIHIEPLSLEFAMSIQPHLASPQRMQPNRKKFFDEFCSNDCDFKVLEKKYLCAPKVSFIQRVFSKIGKIIGYDKA